MNPIFEDILWLSGIGALISTGMIGWLGWRLYQKADLDADQLKNTLKQLPIANLSIPIWVRALFYLPLLILGLWMLNR